MVGEGSSGVRHGSHLCFPRPLCLLAYTVPVLMLFPLARELIVAARFATACREG
ncbi:MAG: hypothetical protein GX837_11465 [Methanomicrobiales archaeon]|jgi:hypothetical protein|nr:hypothetical protein [Methanomicrobiales archaeon]